MTDLTQQDHVNAHDQTTSRLSVAAENLRKLRAERDDLKRENDELKRKVGFLEEENNRLAQEIKAWKAEHLRGKEALERLVGEIEALSNHQQ